MLFTVHTKHGIFHGIPFLPHSYTVFAMKKITYKLSDFQIKTTNPTPDKPRIKLADGGGLYVFVIASGKYWRYDYQHEGNRKTLSIGVYPQVTTAQARQAHAHAAALLKQGTDPSQNKQALAAQAAGADTFGVIAIEWLNKNRKKWRDSHAVTVEARLNKKILPYMGKHQIHKIQPSNILTVLRRIENQGALETAHRCKSIISQIFRYAVATQRADRDLTADLRGALPPSQPSHFAAITDPTEFGEFLKVIHAYEGSYVVQSALKLSPLVFVRPSELRTAKWADINLETGEWRYIVNKTKTPHIVPLARQALKILTDLHALTGKSEYVFPSIRTNTRPMSDNALLAAMRRMDIPKESMCGHGFRASARTILEENLGIKIELIEHQLAHNVKDALGRAYNRTKHLDARHEMMQTWADYLDKLTNQAPDTQTKFKVVSRKKGFAA